MSEQSQLKETIKPVLQTFQSNFWLWFAPTLVIGCVGTTYAFVKSPKWKAWQSVHIRNEINGEQNGRFGNNDERKVAHETIIDIARSRSVIHAALKQVGPPETHSSPDPWPSVSDVEDIQEVVAVSAPKGSEVGGTEVIRLDVTAKTPQRAVVLNRAIVAQTIKNLQNLRTSKASSVISELEQKLSVTQNNLNNATARLEEMENEIGSDLGELRTLDRTGSGESNLRTALTQIKNDLRAAQKNLTSQTELLDMLVDAQKDSNKLVATPSSLLQSLSGLRQLREGLVVAQLKVAQLSGTMSPKHPEVKSAIQAEQEVRQQIRDEIPIAIFGVNADIKVTTALISSLEGELREVQSRLRQLAAMRAPYSVLVNQVNGYTEQLRLAQEALANVRASQDASHKTSLITKVGQVEVSDKPVGPGRLTVAGISWIGGFLIGAGLVFLTSPMGSTNTRRGLLFGRRASDQSAPAIRFGQRATDPTFQDRRAPENRKLIDTDSSSKFPS